MAFDLGVKDGKPVYGGWPGDAQLKQISEENRTIDFVFSDETLDRDTEIIRAQGWQLVEYRKNPQFLFAHEHWSFPIGKSIQTWIADTQLLGRVKFTAAENGNEAGEALFRLYRDGFMNCVSVGFIGIRVERPADWDGRLPSGARCEFVEQMLLECSAVPVPANPNAGMVRAMEPGMADSIRRELDGMKSKGIVHDLTLHAITDAYDRLERRKSLWFPVRQCKHEDPCEEVRQRGECEYNLQAAEFVDKKISGLDSVVPLAPNPGEKVGQVLNSSNKRLLKMMHECCHEMMANAGMEPMEEPDMEPMEEPEEMRVEGAEEKVGTCTGMPDTTATEDLLEIDVATEEGESPEDELLAFIGSLIED